MVYSFELQLLHMHTRWALDELCFVLEKLGTPLSKNNGNAWKKMQECGEEGK